MGKKSERKLEGGIVMVCELLYGWNTLEGRRYEMYRWGSLPKINQRKKVGCVMVDVVPNNKLIALKALSGSNADTIIGKLATEEAQWVGSLLNLASVTKPIAALKSVSDVHIFPDLPAHPVPHLNVDTKKEGTTFGPRIPEKRSRDGLPITGLAVVDWGIDKNEHVPVAENRTWVSDHSCHRMGNYQSPSNVRW